MIDRVTIDKIIDAARIEDVVSEFVTLRRAGVNLKGLCPFHDEKTPSFVVSPSKNICHCFSCGKGGTPVSFLMEHEQMSYPEALRWLANKYHITIEERELTSEEKRQQSLRESLFIVNEWALKYFQNLLKNSDEGRAIGLQYFRKRGFRDDTITRYQLGYALTDNTALATAALKQGFKEEVLIESGLCYRRQSDGRLQDRYAGRVIFPVHTISGRVVAFGGRTLSSDKKVAKYVNSPESMAYHKSNELYGLYQAKQSISKADRCFLVEGYADVTSMSQSGVENIVASSGTSLTLGQIKALRRYTPNITVVYDGDAAGLKASLRGIDLLLAEGMNVRVLPLPDGDDLDSLPQRLSPDELRQYVDSRQVDFIDFKATITLDTATDPVQRSEAISSIIRSVSAITDTIKRSAYISHCAARFAIPEATLVTAMNAMIQEARQQDQQARQRQQQRQALAAQGSSATSPDATTPGTTTSDDTTQTTTTAATMTATTSTWGMAVLPGVDTVNPANNTDLRLSWLLLQAVVRYGERVIYDNVETNEGEPLVSVNVAQFVHYDLDADDLTLPHPTMQQLLQEAADHATDPDWQAEAYFTRHHDPAISQMAVAMAAERYQLSTTLQATPDQEQLRNHVEHLVLDFRRDYVQRRLAELRQEMTKHSNDPQALNDIMRQYQEYQKLYNTISRTLRRS